MRVTNARRVIGCVILLAGSCMAGGCEKPGDDPAGSAAEDSAGPTAKAPSMDLDAIRDLARLRRLGKLHAERDSPEGFAAAVQCFQHLLSRDPDSRQDRVRLAKCLYLAKRPEEALVELAKARELFGDEQPADLLYVSALCEKAQRRFGEAARLLAQVTTLRPHLAAAWFQRGYMEELAKLDEKAVESHRQVIQIEPRHRSAAYRLSMLFARSGKTEPAAEMRSLFQSIPQEGQAEPERCDLLEIVLRPSGKRQDPPRVELSWRALDDWPGDIASLDESASDDARANGRLVLREDAQGRLVAERASGDGPAIAADLENDGVHDVLWTSDRGIHVAIHGDAGTESVRLLHELSSAEEVIDLEACDADHDGDLDVLALIRGAKGLRAVLLVSDGEGAFQRREPFAALAGEGATTGSIAVHDLDQANDLDVVFATDTGGIEVFLNRRDGSFERAVADGLSGRSLVCVEDFDGDGAPDIFASGGSPGWALASNADPLGASPYELRLREVVVSPSWRHGAAKDVGAFDADNDGDLDVVLACSDAVVLLRNENGTLGGDAVLAQDDAQWIDTFDVDGDGRLEVLAGTASGALKVLTSAAQPEYGSLSMRPIGGRDNRGAIGTVVELHRGEFYVSRMLRGPFGVHLGLGIEDAQAAASGGPLDGVRLRWPQGILQSLPRSTLEIDAPTKKPRPCAHCARPKQKEGLVASCPFLWAYGPAGWTFLTDVLGIAPLDEWLPEGATPHLDAEEFVRIDGASLVARDGKLRLAITEELRETAYLDRVELVAVDHPRALAVFCDESTDQAVYADLRVLVTDESGLHAPASVRYAGEQDGTLTVADRDGEYLHAYPRQRSQLAGWVERWSIDLRFPSTTSTLFLTGRVAWYDSSISYALSQSGRTWGPLTLSRVSEEGRQHPLLTALGLPAGMDRTLAVSLPIPLVAGETLRLTSSHRLVWDRVVAAAHSDAHELTGKAGEIELREGRLSYRSVGIARAELSYRGYSETRGDLALHEQTYDYDRVQPSDAWAPATGLATRYGDVTPLLAAHDDLLVVLVSGDAVEMVFEDPGPPAPGQRRTWFLRTSGWAKEASFHNTTGRTIAPLPTRAMQTYPPTAGAERRDKEYLEYLERWQTRRVRQRSL